MPSGRKPTPAPERFWKLVNKSGPDECWDWLGQVNNIGYGRFKVGPSKTRKLTHRFAYELAYGPIPTGAHHGTTCVCHKCDNRLCCNPSHLFLGTMADNHRDRDAKERQPRGETNGWHKLTEEDVLAIRKEYIPGVVTQTELARKFGVVTSCISTIVRRVGWKHVS